MFLYFLFFGFLSYFFERKILVQEEQRKAEDADNTLTEQDKMDRERLRAQQMAEVAAISQAEADGLGDDPARKGKHWSEKVRDWVKEVDGYRIFPYRKETLFLCLWTRDEVETSCFGVINYAEVIGTTPMKHN